MPLRRPWRQGAIRQDADASPTAGARQLDASAHGELSNATAVAAQADVGSKVADRRPPQIGIGMHGAAGRRRRGANAAQPPSPADDKLARVVPITPRSRLSRSSALASASASGRPDGGGSAGGQAQAAVAAERDAQHVPLASPYYDALGAAQPQPPQPPQSTAASADDDEDAASALVGMLRFDDGGNGGVDNRLQLAQPAALVDDDAAQRAAELLAERSEPPAVLPSAIGDDFFDGDGGYGDGGFGDDGFFDLDEPTVVEERERHFGAGAHDGNDDDADSSIDASDVRQQAPQAKRKKKRTSRRVQIPPVFVEASLNARPPPARVAERELSVLGFVNDDAANDTVIDVWRNRTILDFDAGGSGDEQRCDLVRERDDEYRERKSTDVDYFLGECDVEWLQKRASYVRIDNPTSAFRNADDSLQLERDQRLIHIASSDVAHIGVVVTEESVDKTIDDVRRYLNVVCHSVHFTQPLRASTTPASRPSVLTIGNRESPHINSHLLYDALRHAGISRLLVWSIGAKIHSQD